MKLWVRTIMIVIGIAVMLLLIIYTDPTSLREFFHEKSVHSRALVAEHSWQEIEVTEPSIGINLK